MPNNQTRERGSAKTRGEIRTEKPVSRTIVGLGFDKIIINDGIEEKGWNNELAINWVGI